MKKFSLIITFYILAISIESLAQNKINILGVTQDISQKIASPDFSSVTCEHILQKYLKSATAWTGDHYDLSELSLSAEKTMTESWNLRLSLQKKFKEFHAQGVPSEACLRSVRKVLNHQRDVEEYLAEFMLRRAGKFGTHKNSTYQGLFPELLINPQFANFSYPSGFKSGDILMSRGNSFVSAAIARSGEALGQFSHLSLVYIEEKTGKIYTIESHIAAGVLIRPIEDHILQGNARESIYRYHDQQLAHAAAKAMYEMAKKFKEPNNIPYDFERDMNEPSAFDCSEVVREGFKRASHGKILFPMYITRLPKDLMPFINSLGIKTDLSFSPEDMDVDPRVELVAEWRDLNKVEDVRIKNQIADSMFAWMKKQKYSFKFTLTHVFIKNVSWHLRHWPFYFLKERLPVTMPKGFIASGLVMDAVGAFLNEKLFPKMNYILKQRGTPATSQEISVLLEKIRQDDWNIYLEGAYKDPYSGNQQWPFHELFRP